MVYQVLLDPQILIHSLEKEFKGDRNEQIARQMTYLESQIQACQTEDEKLYRAYMAGVFNEVEYAGRRQMIKDNEQKLSAELRQLSNSVISPECFEEQKRHILLVCRTAVANGLAENAPAEIKRNIIKAVVEKVILNVDEGWFELEGVIRGRYPLFADMDAHRQSRPKKRKNK